MKHLTKLLAQTVAAVAIALFWCISAVGTTLGTTVGITTLATAIQRCNQHSGRSASTLAGASASWAWMARWRVRRLPLLRLRLSLPLLRLPLPLLLSALLPPRHLVRLVKGLAGQRYISIKATAPIKRARRAGQTHWGQNASVKEATMTAKRDKARTTSRPKPNLGQKEAKQQELSEEQFSHMRGGKAAKSLEQQKRKEQSK